MNALSTMDPMQQALLSAPLSNTTAPTATGSSDLLSQMLGTPADPNTSDPLSSLLDSLSSGSGAGSADNGSNSSSGFDPSSPAQLFQALGVDPNQFQLNSQTSAIKFDLSMEDDQMSVGAAGQINYAARTIHLSVTMSQAQASASGSGDSNSFVADGMQFSLQFSYAETDATANGAGGMTPSGGTSANGVDAFGGMKDQFVQAVKDAMSQVANVGQDGGDPGSELLQIGQHLGDKLFSLMNGVMQVGANSASTATYGDPSRNASPPSSKLAAMQQVANNLTAETERLRQELNKPKAAAADGAAPKAASGADKMPAAPADDLKPVSDTRARPAQPLQKPFLATQPGAAKSNRLNMVA